MGGKFRGSAEIEAVQKALTNKSLYFIKASRGLREWRLRRASVDRD